MRNDEVRTRGQRAGLNRAIVMDSARALLLERGPGALTIRGLAGRLGVAPNAIYSHVSSKDDLIEALLDDVLAEVQIPGPHTKNPIKGLERLLVSTYDVMLAHPDLVPLYLSRQGARGANAERLGRVMLDLLGRAGVSRRESREALRVLVVYAIGFAAFTTRPWIEPEREPKLSHEAMRNNYIKGLGWLLTGITGTSGSLRKSGS